MTAALVYLARMAYRAPDPDTGGRLVETTRQVELATLDQARTLARQWAGWARKTVALVDPVIVIETHRDGSTIAVEDITIRPVDDRPPAPPALASIARARQALAEAHARRLP